MKGVKANEQGKGYKYGNIGVTIVSEAVQHILKAWVPPSDDGPAKITGQSIYH